MIIAHVHLTLASACYGVSPEGLYQHPQKQGGFQVRSNLTTSQTQVKTWCGELDYEQSYLSGA